MGFTMHCPGSLSNGYHLAGALVNSHNGGLIHHNFIVVKDDGVSGSQVYGKLLG